MLLVTGKPPHPRRQTELIALKEDDTEDVVNKCKDVGDSQLRLTTGGLLFYDKTEVPLVCGTTIGYNYHEYDYCTILLKTSLKWVRIESPTLKGKRYLISSIVIDNGKTL